LQLRSVPSLGMGICIRLNRSPLNVMRGAFWHFSAMLLVYVFCVPRKRFVYFSTVVACTVVCCNLLSFFLALTLSILGRLLTVLVWHRGL
jgi:hypothetical protein